MTMPRRPRGKLQLVGPQEIGKRLGVKTQTVSSWKARGLLPEPYAIVSYVPIWEWRVILDWARKTNRLSESAPLSNGDAPS